MTNQSGNDGVCCGRGRSRPVTKWRNGGGLLAVAAMCVVSGGWTAVLSVADPLWVALVQADGLLTPIARYQDGVWDRPWPTPFRPGLRVDSAGVLRPQLADPGHEPWALPVEVAESRDVTLMAPLRWRLYAGTAAEGELAVRYLRLDWASTGRPAPPSSV